jgi:hypothetical protein
MRPMTTNWPGRFGVAALVVLLGLPLAGCSKEPEFKADSSGVDRSAKPQVIIRKTDVEVDGKLIRLDETRGEEIAALTGHEKYSQASANAYWNEKGVRIHAAKASDKPGNPILVHTIEVWFSQEIDYTVFRPCTPAEQKRHQESVQMRLESVERDEKKHNFPRDEQARRELLLETCSAPGLKPQNAFRGYLEVDGMPIGPNMTLREIQARRKQLGLLPLRMLQVAGPSFYVAPRKANEPWRDQVWEFESPPPGGNTAPENRRIKVIRVP